MNCPKCGFVQEERADCGKCGVVFAKFLAFRAPESTSAPVSQEIAQAVNASTAEHSLPDPSQLNGIKQSIQNLEQRFHELEFERAERRRLHGEMRAFDDRLQENVARIASCQVAIDLHATKLTEIPPAPSLQDFAALQTKLRALDLRSLRERTEMIGSRLEACMQEHNGERAPLEAVSRLEQRLQELETRLDRPAEPKNPIIADAAFLQIDSALKAVEELKISLRNVTVRYTEIGELKKNQLVLHEKVESLGQAFDGLRNDPTNGAAGKTAELEKEVFALKAEVRGSYERIEQLESCRPEVGPQSEPEMLKEFVSLREDFAADVRMRAEDKLQSQNRLENLEARVGESLAVLAEIPGQLEAIASQVRLMDQQYQQLAGALAQLCKSTHGIPQRTTELSRIVEQMGQEYLEIRLQVQELGERVNSLVTPPPKEQSTPVSGEMHVIRENLDEIRRFMATLSRKL